MEFLLPYCLTNLKLTPEMREYVCIVEELSSWNVEVLFSREKAKSCIFSSPEPKAHR